MSFILDALRKSESERQQDARPSITRIPDAVPPRTVPTWAVGTIGILALGVLVLAGAWWRTTAPPPDADRRSAVTVDVTPPAPLPRREPALREAAANARTSPTARETGDRRDALSPVPEESSPASGGTSSIAPDSGRASTSRLTGLRDAASTGASVPSRDRPSAERPAAALPAIDPLPASYDTMASQLGLPALQLELHVYNRDDPASRFVFINGKRYGEGETLSEGPRVLAINSQGAVLLAGSRQLQLTPD